MKPTKFLLAAAAAAAISACGSDRGSGGGNAAPEERLEAVEPPASGDWTEVVTKTPQGGFLMGDPQAKVWLVEYASLTCPHCAEFDENGAPKLIEQYVKDGQVAYELRNFVRDPFDITATLISRCNGAASFFPMTHGLFKDQEDWVGRIQAAPEERLQAVTNLGPDRQFLEIAQLAGLQQWAAMRGVPTAKSTQCLTDQQAIDQLVQMNSDASSQYQIPGTPAFLINGELAEGATTWQALEPKLQEALGR